MPPQQRVEENVRVLKRLAQHIEGRSINICLENLTAVGLCSNADEILTIIEKVGSESFGICLDTGHLNLTVKNHREFILKAGDRLKALHIADNEGVTDQHIMPFCRGNVDFCEVVRALREVGYKGLFNLEIPGERRCPYELRDVKIAFIKTCYDYLMNLE